MKLENQAGTRSHRRKQGHWEATEVIKQGSYIVCFVIILSTVCRMNSGEDGRTFKTC